MTNSPGTTGRYAILCSRFNDLVVDRLEVGARRALVRSGAADDDVETHWVPGALELPIVAKALAESGRFDAIVVLGAVVRGDTYHFEIVANTSAAGLSQVALATGVVITNGILTVDSMEQALDRAGGKSGNKGADAAMAAVETAAIIQAALGSGSSAAC